MFFSRVYIYCLHSEMCLKMHIHAHFILKKAYPPPLFISPERFRSFLIKIPPHLLLVRNNLRSTFPQKQQHASKLRVEGLSYGFLGGKQPNLTWNTQRSTHRDQGPQVGYIYTAYHGHFPMFSGNNERGPFFLGISKASGIYTKDYSVDQQNGT